MRLIPLYVVLIGLFATTKSPNSKFLLDQTSSDKGLLKDQKIFVSGEEREYHLYLPQNTTNAPVVILLHGNRGSNDALIGLTKAKAPYKIWLQIAQRENLVLVVPNGSQGSRHQGWNDCRTDARGNPNTDDVLFMSSLIDEVQEKYDVHPSRTFVVGTSNGGHMALRLAQEIPHKLKAFASIVAANPVNTQCTSATVPISALFINGTNDPILPYGGGPMKKNRGVVSSTQETVDYWVQRNQTTTNPIISELPNTDTTDKCIVKKHLYINGTNNTEVALYKVFNGGHTEPSIEQRYNKFSKRFLGNQNGDIEMANEVWDFFKTK